MAQEVWRHTRQCERIYEADALPEWPGIQQRCHHPGVARPRGRIMTKKTMRTVLPAGIARIGLLVVVATALSSCGINATPVGEITKSPVNFDGKEVTLHGTVKDQTRIP